MTSPRVILIGGAPLTGKTVVSLRLAARLGYACLSTDDLGAAAAAMTTAQSHPDLHPMKGLRHTEYYLRYSPEELADQALRQLRALWPAVRPVIEAHAAWRCPAVIEGWALLPEAVAKLGKPEVAATLLLSDCETMKRRLESDEEFLHGATDPRRLIERFVQRSVWLNAMVEESARELGLPTVHSLGETPAEEVADACLRAVQRTGQR